MLALTATGAVAAKACGDDATATGRFTATIGRPDVDAVRMDIPVTGRPCLGDLALLVEGLDGGAGVLVWLAPGGGADTGRFAIMAPTGDTALRHARVVLRYNPGDEPHAFLLDSGAVVFRREGNRAGGTVAGTGYDAVGGVRPQVQGALHDVVIESTAVPCGAAP